MTVSVSDIARILKGDRKRIGIYCAVGAVVGLIIAFTTPKTYKSTVMLAPEESGMGFSGSISSLASMVGMNMKLGKTGDALYPEIYPDLVGGTDFVMALFPAKVMTKDGGVKCDYYTYLTKHQAIALKDFPLKGIGALAKMLRGKEDAKGTTERKDGLIFLTREEFNVVKSIRSNIECSVDKKTSVITITVQDQDALVAATMADTVKNHLQRAITEYRTKKAKVDLEYMEKLFQEARKQYDKARQLYAAYADANQEVSLQTYKMKEDDLENDMQLKYNIYQQVVEQLQLAKAKVQERTPAFTVMQSAVVPVIPSSTPRMLTLILWIMIGLVVRLGVLGYKHFVSEKPLAGSPV